MKKRTPKSIIFLASEGKPEIELALSVFAHLIAKIWLRENTLINQEHANNLKCGVSVA